MNRRITYRLLPGTRSKAVALSRLAGANRWVWNQILAQILEEVEAGESPSTSFFSLANRFPALRRKANWLIDLPYDPIRYALKHQADAWTQYLQGKRGRPKFKAKGTCKDSFTVPDPRRIKIENNHLYILSLIHI